MKIKSILAGFGLLCMNATLVSADLDPLQNYDNFNTKKHNGCKYCINSDKWRLFQRGDYNTEVSRSIKGKRMHFSQRTWGQTGSDAGRSQGRNRAQFRNSVDFSGACITPRVLKYYLENCPANADSGAIRIRYLGNFFDSGTADDGETGVVYGWINMSRGVDGPNKKDRFNVWGSASECGDTDCTTEPWNTWDGNMDPDLDFGTVKASKNKKAMCVGFDRTAHALVFSFGNDVRTVTTADHGLPAFGNNLSANQTWHVVETRSDVENCTAGRLQHFIEADVDNVQIRKFQ